MKNKINYFYRLGFFDNRFLNLFCGIFVFVIGMAFLLPCVFSLDPYSTSEHLLLPPHFFSKGAASHLLGTDDLGRDLFSRLVFGARNTLGLGLTVAILCLFIGSVLSLLAVVYAGFWDLLIQYFGDVVMCFPSVLLAVVLLAMIGPGVLSCIAAVVTLVTLPKFIRVVKAVALVEMKKDYITAARTLGLSRFKILVSELLPNCLSIILVQTVFAFSDAILMVAILGFLRIGVNPPTAEWGTMLSDAYQFMQSNPALVILPGFCLFLTVFSANLLGDQLLSEFRR